MQRQNHNNVQIDKVSQGKTFGDNPEYGEGICAGLSITRIFKELYLNSAPVYNPFEHPKDRTPFEIQKCHDNSVPAIDCWEKENPSQRFFVEKKNIPFKAVAPELKKSVVNTMTDGQSRGSYIDIYFFLKDRNSLTKSLVGHVVDFTAKKEKNGVRCIAMDSNLFHASGNGQNSCNEIIDTLSQKIKLYPPIEAVSLAKITKSR